MRIIGGKYSGRRIEVSKGFDSRPTTDFAREALFNILTNHFDFEDAAVLDLFSGTGSLSFEFASRGCENIDLVEINGRATQFISKTAGEIGMKGIHAVRMDVFRFIPVCHKKYDIIVADPPYELKNIETIPDLIMQFSLLKENGWFVLEHGKSNKFTNHPRFSEERNYGSVHFSFFR
ncbi:MAG TPA: RsmD family RNA methyltransferase [Bacteroidales bacterium]|nr:RsmD family RNA methyltransferase [Bacteroidales bacterium]